MARLLIYDSGASADTAGNAVDHTFATTEGTAKRSVPVQCFGAENESDTVGLEFTYHGSATTLNTRFFLEFFGDFAPGRSALDPANLPPDTRLDPSIDQNTPWGREVTEEVGSSGAVTHNEITRTLNIAGDATNGACRYLPFTVYAMWMRVAIWVTSIPVDARLRIFAHAGQYDEIDYLADNIDTPYGYNARF